MKSHVFWCTGLSGSGKSTLSELVARMLSDSNYKVKVIDGDVVREKYSEPLGFGRKDIIKNNSIISLIAKDALRFNDIIITPVISPLEEGRAIAESTIGQDNFSLIFFSASLKVVIERDVKGLYAKAKKGIIKDMIGYADDTPFEKPVHPKLIIDSGTINEKDGANLFYNYIIKTMNQK
jgi:adenylylsulfate kinase